MTDLYQIDREIAEKVMGWKEFLRGPTWGYIDKDCNLFPVGDDFFQPCNDWHPTRNIEQAFMVVEKMRELGYSFECSWYSESTTPTAKFGNGNKWFTTTEPFAEAICRASLTAVEP